MVAHSADSNAYAIDAVQGRNRTGHIAAVTGAHQNGLVVRANDEPAQRSLLAQVRLAIIRETASADHEPARGLAERRGRI
jgi:hypothetical protein